MKRRKSSVDRLLDLTAMAISIVALANSFLVFSVEYAERRRETNEAVRCNICGEIIDTDLPYVCQGMTCRWHADCYLERIQEVTEHEQINEPAA